MSYEKLRDALDAGDTSAREPLVDCLIEEGRPELAELYRVPQLPYFRVTRRSLGGFVNVDLMTYRKIDIGQILITNGSGSIEPLKPTSKLSEVLGIAINSTLGNQPRPDVLQVYMCYKST